MTVDYAATRLRNVFACFLSQITAFPDSADSKHRIFSHKWCIGPPRIIRNVTADGGILEWKIALNKPKSVTENTWRNASLVAFFWLEIHMLSMS